MNNSNSNIFTNRILEIDTSRNNVSNIMNPKIRYVTDPKTRFIKVDKEASKPAEDKAPVAVERDNRSMGSPVLAPVSLKPRNTGIVKADDGQKDFLLELNNQTLLSGVIMSEVLGRPKCFRTGRRLTGK